MSIYIIEPRDTALFRDARPFIGTAGANSMSVPWPSTVTGLMRNRGALDAQGRWAGDPTQVLQMGVAGPWLVELDTNGAVIEHYFPAPQDAIFFEDTEKAATGQATTRRIRRRLQPVETPEFASDMPEVEGPPLLPILPARDRDEAEGALPKAASGPTWWKASKLLEWLTNPEDKAVVDTQDIGIRLPETEARMHVAMDAETNAGVDGALFMTKMQRFAFEDERGKLRRFAIVVWADPTYKNDTHSEGKPCAGSVVLGGERRVSHLQQAKNVSKDTLLQVDLAGATTLRVQLLTPAIFKAGYHPQLTLFGEEGEAKGTLIAARTERPQPISGWSIDRKNFPNNFGPKPTRYMVPAGAVYWVAFKNEGAAKTWAEKHHFTTISDDKQDRLDGFGLIAVGRG